MYNRGDCITSDCRRNSANVPDNKMYVSLTSSSSVFSLPSACYIVADPGYDDKTCTNIVKKTLGIDLICPLERYKSLFKSCFLIDLFVFFG